MPELPAVDALKGAIRFLSKPYLPDLYPNPALNFHYETLAALALNQALPDQVDKTVPAYKVIDKRAGDYIEQFKKELGIDEARQEEDEDVKLGKHLRGPTDDEMRTWAGVLAHKGERKVTLEVSGYRDFSWPWLACLDPDL